MTKRQERPQVNFRPTPGLKKRLDSAAVHSGVPLNAEIIRRLEASFVNETLANLVEQTATRVAIEMKDMLMSYVNAVFTAKEIADKRQQEKGNA
jgi:hypothetical protein